MTTVSVHQPNFLPWIGYFQKIMQSDIHVVLDDARTDRGTWTNRVKVLCNGTPRWLTVPLDRSQGYLVEINQIRAKNGWKNEVLNQLAGYYGGSLYFHEVKDFLAQALTTVGNDISKTNLHINTQLLKKMGLREPQLILASTLNVKTTSSQRLVDIVKAVGGSRYLSGVGADGYMDLDAFAKQEIEVGYVNIVERDYPQRHTLSFQRGLSVVDALFSLGFEEIGQRVSDASP